MSLDIPWHSATPQTHSSAISVSDSVCLSSHHLTATCRLLWPQGGTCTALDWEPTYSCPHVLHLSMHVRRHHAYARTRCSRGTWSTWSFYGFRFSMVHTRLRSHRLLDLEYERVVKQARGSRFRWWNASPHLLRHRSPRYQHLPWKASRIRHPSSSLQATQRVLCCYRYCVPVVWLVWLQWGFSIECQLAGYSGLHRHQPCCQCWRIDVDVVGLSSRTQVVCCRLLLWSCHWPRCHYTSLRFCWLT